MLNNGWIKVHRKLQQHPVWSKAVYLKVWLYILMSANTTDKKLIVNGSVYEVPAGTFTTSYRNIGRDCGEETKPLAVSTVKYILDFLQKQQMIEHQHNRHFSHIGVLNYKQYQHTLNTDKTLIEHSQNKSKKDKKAKKIDKRKITQEDYQRLASEYMITQANVKDLHERILNWEQAKYGKPHYKDLNAALHNWIKRSIDEGKLKQGEVVRPWS